MTTPYLDARLVTSDGRVLVEQRLDVTDRFGLDAFGAHAETARQAMEAGFGVTLHLVDPDGVLPDLEQRLRPEDLIDGIAFDYRQPALAADTAIMMIRAIQERDAQLADYVSAVLCAAPPALVINAAFAWVEAFRRGLNDGRRPAHGGGPVRFLVDGDDNATLSQLIDGGAEIVGLDDMPPPYALFVRLATSGRPPHDPLASHDQIAALIDDAEPDTVGMALVLLANLAAEFSDPVRPEAVRQADAEQRRN